MHQYAYGTVRIKSSPWLTEVAKSDVSKNARLVAMALFTNAGAEGDRCWPGLALLTRA